MKLRLPDVTLVMIDATCPELAALSLEDSLDQIEPADVLVCSPVNICDRWIKTPKWSSRLEASAFIWHELPYLIETDFMLLTSWDAWVIDASMWSNEFLSYDYVGAPWWYNDGLNVGHGLLRSRRLMRFLAANRWEFPIGHPEDDLLSRHYRPKLEKRGFRWPSEQIASRFMFECTRPSLTSRHFMFHDSFNFPLVLEGERLAERLRLMRENEYLKGTNKIAELEAGRQPAILPRLAGPTASGVEGAFDAAVMMMRAGRRQEAARVAWEVLRQNPRHADAWALRAAVEATEGRYENAMLHHGFAVQSASGRHDLWVNRGIDAMNARMHKESEESFKQSLALKESFEGHFNYGNLLAATMRIAEAEAHYREALKIDPEHAQAHTNLASVLIGQGNWREGFKHYRHRFASPGFPPPARLEYPQWRGEDLSGKTILLYVEQGFGDEIMSLRFIQPIEDLGARAVLAVRSPMFRLVRAMTDNVVLMYDPLPAEPDYQCALLDVPAYVEITPDTLPLKGGYLRAGDRGFRLEMPPGLNVGICWASGKRDLQPSVAETARQKSLSFQQLAAPLARPGVNLFSLQQSHSDDLAAFGARDPMASVTDFADTAFIIDHLDLVVTVDTSVAHLAGAMGKPVWNLVRVDALWPWMQENGTTCWYDSMIIYRQEKPFDWSAPLKRLKADFDALVARKAAA